MKSAFIVREPLVAMMLAGMVSLTNGQGLKVFPTRPQLKLWS